MMRDGVVSRLAVTPRSERAYDIIARVEADRLDDLGGMVVSGIQAVEGVSRTLTCPILGL